jgi:hypothetical protein
MCSSVLGSVEFPTITTAPRLIDEVMLVRVRHGRTTPPITKSVCKGEKVTTKRNSAVWVMQPCTVHTSVAVPSHIQFKR